MAIDQSYLFPRNDALIRVEKLCFTQQTTTTQITVMLKGDTFALNFSNPIYPDDVRTVEDTVYEQTLPQTIDKGLSSTFHT